jgi:endoglucanase
MDWAYWALQGSYYVRDANADVDESFGLLKKDWSDWRNTEFKGLLGNMWQQTQGP